MRALSCDTMIETIGASRQGSVVLDAADFLFFDRLVPAGNAGGGSIAADVAHSSGRL